jgi:hypothetical protein
MTTNSFTLDKDGNIVSIEIQQPNGTVIKAKNDGNNNFNVTTNATTSVSSVSNEENKFSEQKTTDSSIEQQKNNDGMTQSNISENNTNTNNDLINGKFDDRLKGLLT